MTPCMHLLGRHGPYPSGYALTACTETTTAWTEYLPAVTCHRCLRTLLYRRLGG